MTDAERIEALLGLVDPDLALDERHGAELVVLGLASVDSRGRSYRPTTAGWVLLGEKGRRFQPAW
jgi:hypothetical protein